MDGSSKRQSPLVLVVPFLKLFFGVVKPFGDFTDGPNQN